MPIMTEVEFFTTVQTMREKQREFFLHRDKLVLAECKKLERAVDQQIQARANPQAGLFA